MGMPTDRAADAVPPTEQNATALALTGTTASAVTPTGAGEGGRWFSWTCTVTHNVRFSGDGTNTVTDPLGVAQFAAGTIHRVQCSRQNTHFKATGTGSGTLLYWLSSRS